MLHMCNFSFLFCLCIIDHGHVEPESEEPTEPAQVEEAANTELTEGNHLCIPPIILGFSLITIYMLSMLVQ
jgi:hypothetical protein